MGIIKPSMGINPKMSISPIMSMEALAAPVEESPITYQKFVEMELPEDETEDGDYSPSEADSDDSLEWASETERTMAEDALVEGKVGIDFYGAARAAKRAGAKNIEVESYEPSVIVSILNSVSPCLVSSLRLLWRTHPNRIWNLGLSPLLL